MRNTTTAFCKVLLGSVHSCVFLLKDCRAGAMSGAARKITTNIAGLEVCKYPQHTLSTVYRKILQTLSKMPQDAAYRKYTEEIIKERNAVVQKHGDDWVSIEKEIKCGQLEELVLQAEHELVLARKMLLWKPWEPLISHAEPDQWKWPPTK